MKNATLYKANELNEFELIVACDHYEQRYPNEKYTVRPGNNCIWITNGRVHLYYIFQEGKIVDIQVD
jgi:hypothetical protein